ncbi:CHRD domain-containing protein [Hanstruepera flava]|uniref:CHRD domain-containing protein n=1 Tax=Hanstruepera flava TaxID=2930218 RepID=UPI0020281B4F|nr:CHRD domain-containing protein [Hanstruepera flava]
MKKSILLLFSIAAILFTNCASDENSIPIDSSLTYIEYDLSAVENPVVTGYVRFVKGEDQSITAQVILSGLDTNNGSHPARIYYESAVEGGSIAITLNPVNSNTGRSTTTFTALDDGTPITYEELIIFNGHLNVHVSSNNLDSLLAQGDIGENDLTGNTKTYALSDVDMSGISGTAKFSERENGEALAVIELANTVNGSVHPAHIHGNTALEGGAVVFTFNNINGDTGISKTNVSQLDDGTEFGFTDITEYDGHINVHLDPTNLQTIVSHGDIGENELTGAALAYPLNEVDVPGIQGTATFYQRNNGMSLAVITLENAVPGASYPSHIHSNDLATTGPIIFTFNNVDGDTGISETNIEMLDDGTSFGYDEVGTVNGYINVHLSDTQLDVLVAQGNIGSNN